MTDTVYVVLCTDTGYGTVTGVFSSLDKATDYISQHGYSGFVVTEHMVDTSLQSVQMVKSPIRV